MAHKNSYLKTSFAERTTTINEDGEVLQNTLKKHTFIAGSKEQFFLGYVTMLSVFKEISGPAIKVYSYLLMSYQTDAMIGINMAVKKEIKAFIGSNAAGVGTIDNCLSELTKQGLLYKKADVTGGYYINPRYAFKGSTKERDNKLKALIELGCSNC